ncbi:LGFP repeat-containing protein [Tomitella fengzijianii]|uniref:Esterase n=1 Tax=Tomitella fengzijianii TaxID=2597660 RepID=A0A516X683_9ACTN|nr:esterase [Tomitella fengzijianii]QDQ98555.1 esterase [Tomitella fengzijianii]
MRFTHRNSTLLRKTALTITSLAAAGALAAGCSSDTVDSAKDAAGAASDAADSAKDAAGAAGDKAKDAAGQDGGGDDASGGEATETQIQGPQGEITVVEPIADKYQQVGGPGGHLGNPVGEQQQGPAGGYFVDFEGASIYWSPQTDAHFVQGRIKDAWLADGGVEALGYPTSDEHPIETGLQSEFENARITFINDQTEVITEN